MATKNPRMKAVKIELLKRAKKLLAKLPMHDHCQGICGQISIAASWSDSDLYFTASRELRYYISAGLGRSMYLHNWMTRRGIKYNSNSLREARLAWIDWMIASLEGKN